MATELQRVSVDSAAGSHDEEVPNRETKIPPTSGVQVEFKLLLDQVLRLSDLLSRTATHLKEATNRENCPFDVPISRCSLDLRGPRRYVPLFWQPAREHDIPSRTNIAITQGLTNDYRWPWCILRRAPVRETVHSCRAEEGHVSKDNLSALRRIPRHHRNIRRVQRTGWSARHGRRRRPGQASLDVSGAYILPIAPQSAYTL